MSIHDSRKSEKNRRTLLFAIGTTASCALVIAAPLLGPRLLAGSRWNEPDTKAERTLKESGSYITTLGWSRDGKRMRYFVGDLRNRSWSQRSLVEVERTWPEMKPLSRRDISPEEPASLPTDFVPEREEHGLSLGLAGGRYVQMTSPSGRLITRRVGLRLELKRHGRKIRLWSIPDSAEFPEPEYSSLLSPDGTLAMLVTRTRNNFEPKINSTERDLWDALRSEYSETVYQFRIYRTSDGGLVRSGKFSGKVRGINARGGLWIQRLQSQMPVLFDGRALWFALAPYYLPRDAESQFRKAKALIAGGYPMPSEIFQAYSSTLNSIRAQVQRSNELVLFDALGNRSRTLAPAQLKMAKARRYNQWPDENMTWDDFGFSPDGKRAKAKLSGSGSIKAMIEAGAGAVYVWDFYQGRGLWQSLATEGTYVMQAKFSPDSHLLAYASQINEPGNPSPLTPITVAEASSGKVLGAPLLEETPAQRFERARLKWQYPLQRQLRSILRQSSAVEMPADNRLIDFAWAPDSRRIVAQHSGAVLKTWRVQ